MENNELNTAQEIKNDTKRNCQDVVLGIMQLAMECHDDIEITAYYLSGTKSFIVRAYERSCDKEHYNSSAYLDINCVETGKTPLQKLLEIEDKLLDLIAEAKDNAEVAA